MTDEYEVQHEILGRPDPALRIAATYPASDGRAPESIDVEVAHGVSAEAVAPLVDAVVGALARVAHGRDAFLPLRDTRGASTTVHVVDDPASRTLYDAANPRPWASVRTDAERRVGAGVEA